MALTFTTGNTFSPGDTVTATKLNNVVNSLTTSMATAKVLGRATAGAGAIEEIDCTAAGRALLDDANASDQRTTLGLGTIATQAASNVAITGGSIAVPSLTGVSPNSSTTGAVRVTDASGNPDAAYLQFTNNAQNAEYAYIRARKDASGFDFSKPLLAPTITGGTITGITDLAVADGGTGASDAANARTNLGLGTMATQASSSVSITGGSISGITDLPVADGGTGASNAANARTNFGIGTASTSIDWGTYGGSATAVHRIGVPDGTIGIHMRANGSGPYSFIEAIDSSGNLKFQAKEDGTVTCVSLVQSSALRFKEDIRNLESAKDAVAALRPVRYKAKDGGKESIGLIAEEVETVLPEFVGKDAQGQVMGINYAQMVAVLIKAVQELQAEVTALKSQ